MYVCHAVSCTDSFDPATTAAAINWALFGKFRQPASQLYRREDDSQDIYRSKLTSKNSFGSNERQPAGDVDPTYEETLVRLATTNNSPASPPLCRSE
jgi:hypothetical protein